MSAVLKVCVCVCACIYTHISFLCVYAYTHVSGISRQIYIHWALSHHILREHRPG